MIIPSIDLMGGKAVQLRQGKEKVLEREDILSLVFEFRKYGEIALIDLDSAFGKGNNLELIKKICKLADCRVGGGIRTIEKANEILRAGAKKIIIGTKATKSFLKQLPKERLIVAVDSKNGFIVNKGWTKKTNKKTKDLVRELEPYCSGFLFTDVEREGLMKGIDYSKIKRLKETTKNKITAAGGITSLSEIKWLENEGIDSQLGMCIYTGKISLKNAFVSLLDFEKGSGLIPTIAKDENGQVLMLGFSNKESLLKTFEKGNASYYSRSRKKLWTKGETSGNYQEILKARYDCDRDSLLFTVRQKNFACHEGKYSCFGEKEFSFEELYETIESRIKNPRPDSYTSRIAASESKIKQKIKEECTEVLEYRDKENLVWEISDLFYFVFVLMAKKGVDVKDIENELWRRRR
ncbi:MAG TPA: bifunctional phosphoribosyl-AMP cyclohydrolase/phosphoribosyl-ATP diphosphatase HisIE [Candidatus Nanoarchaeia archaeon]|nr:bifunctional phosphoribosyl-AMP cyclohydrolase/phosphoribosyl-ATP diphosphatase HisIE [Candidatus Nanoarchaeia archaeon]